MQVIIDGVEYVPLFQVPWGNSLLAALEVRFDSDAGDNISVRDYLRILLETLWKEEQDFNSKRPFGNSGWQRDVYAALIAKGFLEGKVDDDGNIEYYRSTQAYEYLLDLIRAAFYGVK